MSVCTCTHVRIGTVRMIVAFFFSDGALCFFLIFFVILLACGVSVCACTHVRMCSPIILLSLPHKVRRSGLFYFISHPTKQVPQFNSIESPPPPAASYLLGGAEIKRKRIRPESDPARAIRRHPICRDPTCVAGARSPKPLQN
jgi:hypothetical protein